ncbi:DUF452 family protein [Gabonibacter chumensis]|uniref:DUF452 family protein n=1 Tax=Gabonibacter chumensis TaxID=2972474 RepID=UPI0025740196|nr:pimeloyl-ACP methyl esterase BioG family protein [Gabonibacter chumensis]MCR9012453.1 DUF452 family protein [Gabonibacter chumensis]
MRRVWLKKNGNKRVILFFSGWGLDERAVSHMTGESDVLMLYDYRNIEGEKAPVLNGYESIDVIAWSMGVWAASVLLPLWNLPVDRSTAINGTERPVDNLYGIPLHVYLLTERGMNERGRDKFFVRMLSGTGERTRFKQHHPDRNLEEQLEELKAIREQSDRLKGEICWNRVYISENDIIFPVTNQENWWRGRSEIKKIEGGHYPFYVFENWDLII